MTAAPKSDEAAAERAAMAAPPFTAAQAAVISSALGPTVAKVAEAKRSRRATKPRRAAA